MGSKSLAKKKKYIKDGITKTAPVKSYAESSKSFVSPDFANRCSWFFESTRVTDETATDFGDQTTYTFAPNDYVINLNMVTDREDYKGSGTIDCTIVVKVNDVVQSSGYSITFPAVNTKGASVVFDSALSGGDVVKVTYSKEAGSAFEVVAASGKQILLDYVETQFSAGATFNDTLVFELIADFGGGDVVLGKTEYITAQDFLNKGNHGSQLKAFGGLTTDVNVFPWNYLTGFTIKPYAESVNPANNEFHKIKMYLKNNTPYTDCEIATGTFYCLIEDL